MIEIYNFDKCKLSGISYDGPGGSKKGILIDGEYWFLKYPKSTGINTHKTLLGIEDEKVVVACKDFMKNNNIFLNFNMLKNDYEKMCIFYK